MASDGLFSSDEDAGGNEGIAIFPAGPVEGVATIQELQDAINKHGMEYGYAVSARCAGDKKDGVYTSYRIECDKFGLPAKSKGTGLRKTATKKTGCEFFGRAKLEGGVWSFKHAQDPKHHVHNHQPSLHPSAHLQNRKMKPLVRKMIERLSAYTAIRAREILAMVQEEYPDTCYTVKDINNIRQAIRRRSRGGCMASGATIKAFDELGIEYIAKWDDDDPNLLLGLIWTFETCQKMWKRFPDCLSCDNTYRTNNWGFPLFVVTVQTNVNSVANIAFGLIDNERREGFDFLADAVNQLRIKIEARPPSVTITDKDERMRDALNAIFPDAQKQLCRFHINQNVRLQARKKGKWKKRAAKAAEADDQAGLRYV